ncbi:type II toxin-antitoxin system RelE/ParE family toxin [Deferrisoma palaeochoriense]
MSLAVSIHEAAEQELNEAADFYDLESPGLGAVFIREVERTIENIRRFPEAAPLLRGRVRRWTLPHFPYTIVYSVRPQEIRILAVAHQKRRPFYWTPRR